MNQKKKSLKVDDYMFDYNKRKFSQKSRSKLIISLLISSVVVPVFFYELNLSKVSAATQTEAFEAITTAFELIEQASEQGINVTNQATKLNSAISDYNSGNYNNAYNVAQEIIVDVEELIDNYRTGRLFPYILIPFNLALVASLIIFFGRNVKNWYQKRRDEEYLDLEIVYENGEERN
ncbi:MAG: hypothetical protein HZR80_17680 [Candidatus Heimdallarchaeota archaeon]